MEQSFLHNFYNAIYVEQHLYPQLKDLITKYKPDLIWADGPDNYDEETWKLKNSLHGYILPPK